MAYSYYHLHVDIMQMLFAECAIRNVMEFGAGEISTKSLLDKTMFPKLERLYSIENNRHWTDSLGIDDARWTPIITDSEFFYQSEVEPILTNDKPDLILVDSFTIAGRIATLNYLSDKDIDFIILHDAQHSNYDNVLELYQSKFRLALTDAHAVLMSNRNDVNYILEDIFKVYMSGAK